MIEGEWHGPSVTLVIKFKVFFIRALKLNGSGLSVISPYQRSPGTGMDDLTHGIALFLSDQDSLVSLIIQHEGRADNSDLSVNLIIMAYPV